MSAIPTSARSRPHGELYLDDDGKVHFLCHTPGNVSFIQLRDAFEKFIEHFQNQLARQSECPFHIVDQPVEVLEVKVIDQPVVDVSPLAEYG